ncbi:MAG: RsbRD N-terminal domain-containing protein [Melioribacteraceae bacterium]|nr:RsbRD N-terminal domain-containing protein [Melioribacteraceae bacterium]
MLYQKYIRLVEDHADQLTRKWSTEVRNNPSTPGYKKIPEHQLNERVYDVFKRLGDYLLQDEPDFKKTAEHFIKLGRERAKEGMKVSEVIYALILERVVIWNFIVEEGIISSTLDLHEALGFYMRINNFFDKAVYFIAKGFENVHLSEVEVNRESEVVNKSVDAVMRWFIKKQNYNI